MLQGTLWQEIWSVCRHHQLVVMFSCVLQLRLVQMTCVRCNFCCPHQTSQGPKEIEPAVDTLRARYMDQLFGHPDPVLGSFFPFIPLAATKGSELKDSQSGLQV